MQATQLYRCLSEPLRLRILHLLLDGPMCVCNLQAALEENQVKVSKHLAYLRRCRLVEKRKQGPWAFYQLSSNSPLVRENLKLTEQLAEERAYFKHDAQRLQRLKKANACK